MTDRLIKGIRYYRHRSATGKMVTVPAPNQDYCTTCLAHGHLSQIWAVTQMRSGQCEWCYNWNRKNLADPTEEQIDALHNKIVNEADHEV